jgi:hypothetical protein
MDEEAGARNDDQAKESLKPDLKMNEIFNVATLGQHSGQALICHCDDKGRE